LLADGVPATLGARAFDLLLALAGRPGQLLTKHALMDEVWPGVVVEENNLAAQISALRKVLGGDLIATIPGRGYRFTAHLEAAGHEPSARDAVPQVADAPPAAEAPALRTNLPARPAPLIGRGGDLAALAALVDAHRLVTLVGAGGMGKTRLAQAFLHAQQEAWRHGVCWIELATVADPGALPGAIASALGVRPPAGEPLAGLAGAVAPLQMLIAFDNAEHLLDEVALVAQTLLDAAPGLRIIVTSQVPLKLAAERVFRLESLAVPQGPLPASQAIEFGAVALFVDRAQAADARFALSDANAPAAIALCAALDGLALAIELAAARVPMFGVQQLAASMQDRLQVLTTSRDRAAPARHQTLRAALEWSHGLLNDREQTVFRRLSVFAGSTSLALIQRVVADPPHAGGLDEWTVLDALSGLVDRSLVAVVGGMDDTRPRYRMLASPRALALEQLRGAGEEDALRRRHALALAQLYDEHWHTRHSGALRVVDWKREVELDAPNASDAMAWAVRTGMTDCALTIGATWLHAMNRFMHADRMGLADSCTALATLSRTPELRMRAALATARAWTNPRKRRAFAAVDHALSLAREIDATAPDRWLLYRALAQWVVSGSSLADLSPDALKSALDELDRIEDPAWPPQRLDVGLEAHAFFLSRSDAGPEAATARLALIRRTAAIAAQLGDDVETSLNNLMDAELASGAVDAAARTGRALIEQLSGTRNEHILAYARLNLGACHLALDELDAGRAMLQAAWAKAAAFEMQPYCADYLALLAALERRPRAAAWLAGYSDAGYRAKSEGRERNEAAASERMAALAIAQIGAEAFENGRAGGCALTDDEVARIAFAATDMA
ncbi:MAG TPA: winged helix-turn-helix domain-containing protein, partial [Burkholderiaceae bacterium]